MQFIKSVHKWASLFVGIQFLLWLVSGFYFNIMDHSKAGGNQYRERIEKVAVDYRSTSNQKLIDPKLVLAENKKTQNLQVVTILGKPYYLLTHEKGLYRHFYNEQTLVDAYTNQIIVIDEHMAKKIALTSYNGPGKLTSVIKLMPPIQDIPKEKNTVWQVNFNDNVNHRHWFQFPSSLVDTIVQ